MKKIVILSEHFAPAYKAGGIVRSLENLVRNFGDLFTFYIIAANTDLGEQSPMPNISIDQWTAFDNQNNISVLYLSGTQQNRSRLRLEISKIEPDVIYINGIYSVPFVITPLRLINQLSQKPLVIVAPRGMLQQGALAVKALKKKFFFSVFKLFGLHKGVRWHATDLQEVTDIKRMFGSLTEVVFANDTPDLLPQPLHSIKKEPYSLLLVTISLITAKKGQLQLLEVLQSLSEEMNIEYHIYGPVKDNGYWQACTEQIKRLPSNIKVSYKGNIHPSQVTETLRQYHFFVLPSLGENFGHAIYESLNAGRPVIISDQTPWKRLEERKAGWDIDLKIKQTLPQVLKEAYLMDQSRYDQLCTGAQHVAQDFVRNSDFKEQYQKLFNAEAQVHALL